MEFVNISIAKKLKEKGYPQVKKNTLAMYNEDGEWYSLAKTLDDFEYSFEDFDAYDYICPTISQVLKWLREECGVFILIEPDILHPEYRLTFTIKIKFYIKGEEDEGFSYKYLSYRRNSYEEATLAGIEYVLDNLI